MGVIPTLMVAYMQEGGISPPPWYMYALHENCVCTKTGKCSSQCAELSLLTLRVSYNFLWQRINFGAVNLTSQRCLSNENIFPDTTIQHSRTNQHCNFGT